MELRLLGSDETYPAIEAFLYDLQRVKNKLDGWQDVSEAERQAEIDRLEGLLEEMSH